MKPPLPMRATTLASAVSRSPGRSAACHGWTDTTASGAAPTAAAMPSSRPGPGRTSASRNTRVGGRRRRGTDRAGVRLAHPAVRQRGRRRRPAPRVTGDGGGVVGRVVVDHDQLVAGSQLRPEGGQQRRAARALRRAPGRRRPRGHGRRSSAPGAVGSTTAAASRPPSRWRRGPRPRPMLARRDTCRRPRPCSTRTAHTIAR